jgi:multisubunit Na+/H+ antiporter MnhG subunit
MLLGNSRVTLVGIIIAIFGVAFMFGGHPVIAALLLLLAWVLLKPPTSQREGPCMLEHHEAGTAL